MKKVRVKKVVEVVENCGTCFHCATCQYSDEMENFENDVVANNREIPKMFSFDIKCHLYADHDKIQKLLQE